MNIQDLIIYEDASLLIVNKPTNLLSVPGRAADNKDCLITRLQNNGYPEALTVHRLDYETSGLIVYARNKEVHRNLSIQFQDRITKKQYQALIFGEMQEASGAIYLPLRYDEPNKPRHIVDLERGKHSLTFYQKLAALIDENNHTYTKILLIPYTGRSHQLRVHMQSIKQPILGDSLYATDLALTMKKRLCLHSSYLSFIHPQTNQQIKFESEPDFS